MIALLLSTSLCFFLFISFGFFIAKFMKTSYSFTEKSLIGLVACNTVTTCISLFFPINIFVLLFLITLGLFFVIIIKKDLKTYILSLYGNKYIILCSLSFISIAFLISLDSPNNYDTGLYHLQSIKWIEEYSIVPGLANLHGRFGFNPNIFTLFALTSIHHLFKQEIFSLNFTVFAILVFYFVNKLYSLFKQQGITNLFVFYTFLFLIILKLPNLSSPSPDFISTVITLFIFARILDLSGQKVNPEFKSYIPILVLSIYIVTVKLAAFPILLLFIFVFIKYKSELRKSLWLLPILSLIIIPWLARNIVTTGWLVYPFPSLDLFSFDWKVPLGSVINEKEAVVGWARNPSVNYIKAANMAFVDWFQIWWQGISFPNSVLFLISIAFPLIALISQLIKKIKIDLFTNAVIITSFFGVIFWLFLAPDWRFGESFILIASMSPLLFLKSYLRLTINPKFISIILLI
ncbi:MAG: LIC_10190 family membrane protein, partial [Methanobacterium sp.]